MKKNHIFFVLALAFLCFAACEEPLEPEPLSPEKQLPPKTQEGKNTLGCLIDGRAYVMCAGPIDASPILGNGSPIHVSTGLPDFRSFGIDTRDECSDDNPDPYDTLSLTIWLDENDKVTVKYADYANFGKDGKTCQINDNFRYHDTLSPINFIKVTYFQPNRRIIAGEFEFDLYTPGCTDTLHLRKGRFDVKF